MFHQRHPLLEASVFGDSSWRQKLLKRPLVRPLSPYRLGLLELGPHTPCKALKAFKALSLDEFLVGGLPGPNFEAAPSSATPHQREGGSSWGPLSLEKKQELLRSGLDFAEPGGGAPRCRMWDPHERERWQRSRRLRSLIKKGQVRRAQTLFSESQKSKA